MNYWWVNQNQTYRHEVSGGYLWSPKVNTNGAANHFYDNMARVKPGDVIFSFCDTLIKAIGVATGVAQTATKPTEFGTVGDVWGSEGWYVPVEFKEIKNPIRPKDHIDALRPTLPAKYSPLQDGGNGNQGAYLALVPASMASVLRRLLSGQLEAATQVTQEIVEAAVADDEGESLLKGRTDIPETEKEQLIKARRGQGLFRSRVELLEAGCRITGVTERSHLRASHTKPWRDSSDFEKLDGNNGLLLAPHIDHLFDRGYISFEDSGALLVSPQLSPEVLAAWHIAPNMKTAAFTKAQATYLAFHREHIFKV
jgi:putative restriction endonuclease